MPPSPLARSLALLLATSLLLVAAPPARAEEGDDAKRHFLNGVHLFQDHNYGGALAEFDASFQAKPTAVALQNIAISQKALFRYADAISTLERLLREFGPSLSAADKRAAEEAIRDMNGLLGAIVVDTNVPGAVIAVNGNAVAPDARKGPIRLAAGEYRVSAEAPGFERAEERVTVVSGDKPHAITLTLAPLGGTLIVHSEDPQAAIAIDRLPKAWGDWTGALTPGAHTVYVYREGFTPFIVPVNLVAGQSTVINAPLGQTDSRPYAGPYAPPPPYVAKPQRGYYGFFTLAGYTAQGSPPQGLEKATTKAGSAAGLRAGYRVSTAFAVELMVEGETVHVDQQLCAAGGTCTGDTTYDLRTVRFGPNARFMTKGASSRAFGAIGIGAALHALEFGTNHPGNDSTYGGVDPYLLVEGGIDFQFGHWVATGAAGISLESMKNVASASASAYADGSAGLAQVFLGLRLGYSQW